MRYLLPTLALFLTCCSSEPPPPQAAAPHFEGTDAPVRAARLQQGERLTWVLGCRGCHAKDLAGQLWDDDPRTYGTVWAPNLTQAASRYNEAQLEAIILRGEHPIRPALYSMPSEMFQRLESPDHSALIAYLKSLKPVGRPSPPPILGPKARAQIADGTIKSAAALVRETSATLPYDAGPPFAFGRYIASVACVECHGTMLDGKSDEEGKTPDLAAAAAYSRKEFEALATRGVAKDNRKIDDLMVSVGKNRLSHLTRGERDALYAYLVARANRPQ